MHFKQQYGRDAQTIKSQRRTKTTVYFIPSPPVMFLIVQNFLPTKYLLKELK